MTQSKEAKLLGLTEEEFQQLSKERVALRESRTHYVICFTRTGRTQIEGYISDSICAVGDLLDCNDIRSVNATPLSSFERAQDYLLKLIDEDGVEWADDIDGDTEDFVELDELEKCVDIVSFPESSTVH